MDKLEPLAVSAPEAARLLGVSKPTIYQYIHQDGFPAFKLVIELWSVWTGFGSGKEADGGEHSMNREK